MPTDRQQLTYEENTPIRVDVYLAHRNKDVSRNYLSELFEKKLVLVNGLAVKKGHLLKLGDVIAIEPFLKPDERVPLSNPTLPLAIVHGSQNQGYIVIDKPSAMPTHPNVFEDDTTVVNAVIARFPSVIGVGEEGLRPGIVHRLDTDTSGLLIVALTQKAYVHFRALFDERKVKKTYLALVLGKITKAGQISTPLAHHPKNPRKMVAVEKGKSYRSKVREASTMYEPLEAFENYTLVKVRTLTGRMHQVRVHMASISHPLCGDVLYQSPKERSQDTAGLHGRHFLHASRLEFMDVDSEKVVELNSVLPQDLQGIVDQLKTGE